MNTNLIYYSFLVILILFDIILYIDEIVNNPSSKIYKAKIEKKTLYKNGYKYILDEDYIVIDAPNDKVIEILDEIENKKITNINLDKTIICTKFIIGANVNVITKLDLVCEEVENKSANFKIKDGIIFDKFNNVICIFKENKKKNYLRLLKDILLEEMHLDISLTQNTINLYIVKVCLILDYLNRTTIIMNIYLQLYRTR